MKGPDKRWLVIVGLALVLLVLGCAMACFGQPGAATVLLFSFMAVTWFGVLEEAAKR